MHQTLKTGAVSQRSVGSNVSTARQQNQANGGVVKTIILPHEDVNRLGTEAQELLQFMQQ